jgi:hypothetical protein
MQNQPIQKPAVQARQGEKGKPVRNVLVISLSLAILVGLVYFALIAS